MKKIIPFKKEILFKTNINEIISIALDKDLKIDKDKIFGSFKLYGEYNDYEDNKPFSIDIPYENYLDDELILDNAIIDIEDFYYEILEEKKLIINIEIKVDNIESKPLVEREESVEETFEKSTYNENNYMTYRVYIVRQDDTVDSICEKYEIEKDLLAEYNVLNNINIGDKLIIPNARNK